MLVSSMQTLYQALVCKFSLRVTQPHLLPICSDSGCICQGSPDVKPSPCFCILPKPTPATGSQYFQIFFSNYNSKVLHWQMLHNIDEKHTGWSLPSLSPVSLSILLPVLSYPLHSLPFTSFLYIHTPFLLCYSLSPHSVTSLTRSVLSATNWKDTAVFREKRLTHNRLLCEHTTAADAQTRCRHSWDIQAHRRAHTCMSGAGLNITAQECQCLFENILLVSYKV